MPLDLEVLERLLAAAVAEEDSANHGGIDYRTARGAWAVALRNAAPELLRLARRGQASASGWKAGAEAMRNALAREYDQTPDAKVCCRHVAEFLRRMPLPAEPQSQAPEPSADELAGALAHAVLAWNLDPEGRIDGGIIAHARALLARRRA